MGKEKLGFFKKMFLVITDFRTYPFLVKHEKFGKTIGYFVLLMIFLSAILSTSIFIQISGFLSRLVENFDEVPEFVYEDGVLSVSDAVYQEITPRIYLIIDTQYTYEEYVKTREYITASAHDMLLIFNSDRMTAYVAGEPYSYLDLQQFDVKITEEDIYEEVQHFNNSITAKAQVFVVLFASLFLSYLSSIFFKIILIAFLVSLMCMSREIRLNLANYFKIAIYAYTFPLLVEVVVACIVGPGKSYTYWASVLLLYVYLLYAIRAIRLDAFIMMFSRKDNVKHTSQEFENELEKYKEMVADPEEFQDSFEDKKNTTETPKETNDEKKEERSEDEDKKE